MDLQALQSAWERRSHNAAVEQDCATPLLPLGFVLKIVIWSSWGDPHYVGLSALEVHDAVTGVVAVDGARVSAEPVSSVADLPTMAGDARTIVKLVRSAFAQTQGARLHAACCLCVHRTNGTNDGSICLAVSNAPVLCQ
jgi:Domain of unknown function (DUF4457)